MSEQEKTLKIDGADVKVKPAETRRRIEYRCQECSQSFPNSLDFEAHQKLDHVGKAAVA